MLKESVCVIGAGISGVSVATRLASRDLDVLLVDKNPHPGGQSVFYGCKAVDSCVRCGVCLVREEISGLQSSASIRSSYSTSVDDVRRMPDGTYQLDLSTTPNIIDPDRCIECGLCAKPGSNVRHVPGWKYFVEHNDAPIDELASVCPVDAIRVPEPVSQTVNATSVVLSTGFTPFDPALNRKWGDGRNPRVLTGSRLEELFQSEEYIPEEVGDHVSRMAFVQCVGSRNIMEGEPHCSRVCCAYALRMANRLIDRLPGLEIDFYYMDIQPFGKSFDAFWGQIRDKMNFVRSNPISIRQDARGRPIVRYESQDDLSCHEQAYDLLALSNGICPSKDTEPLGTMLGLSTVDGFFPNSTSRSAPGVFVAGTCKSPMRIDECVEDAVSISERVLNYLGERVQVP